MARLTVSLLPICLAAGLAGCDANLGDMKAAADTARIQTEQMAFRSAQASNERERRTLEEALDRDAAIAAAENDSRFVASYWIRKDDNGYTVYDTRTGKAAIFEGKAQTGLTRGSAEGALDGLQREEGGLPR